MGFVTIITGLFKASNWKLLAIAATIIGVMFLVWQYKSALKEQIYQTFYAKQVEEQLKRKEQELELFRQLAEDKDKQIKLMIIEKNRIQVEVKKLRNIANDPTKEDGNVAPVLRDVIDAIQNKSKNKPINTENQAIEKWREGTR